MQYLVISKWCGWYGGWGSESDIAALCNAQGAQGWRLVRSENGLFAWMYIILRRKVLLFFERETTPAASPTP
ncbi:MAG: hypothetical protein HW375_28 [Anaerolineales bacterium]|nr:hypothetical protein [Anaerolineales bacterium]